MPKRKVKKAHRRVARSAKPPVYTLPEQFTLRDVPIADLQLAPETRFRSDRLECRPVIERYAADMREGLWRSEESPITVVAVGEKLYVPDGWMRKLAAEQVAVEKRVKGAVIRAKVYRGTLDDVLAFGVGANAKHGAHRSNEDARRAVLAAVRNPRLNTLSTRELGELVHVSATYVSQARRGLLDGVNVYGGKKFGDEWYTPPEIVNAVRAFFGQIDLDPASDKEADETARVVANGGHIFTEEDDGLSRPWVKKDGSTGARVWLNMPYSKGIGPWVQKALEESGFADRTGDSVGEDRKENAAEVVMLVPVLHSDEWFQRCWDFPVCFLYDRIKFRRPRKAGKKALNNIQFHHVVVYLGPRGTEFAWRMEGLGYCPGWDRRRLQAWSIGAVLPARLEDRQPDKVSDRRPRTAAATG